ncbi:hypothetical protein INR49_016432 [Caranx melampygus]|nr:hypothetical protein INR49_016432 [Caranx melampygus]
MDIIQPLMDMANGAIVPPPALQVPTDPQPVMQPAITSASAVPAVPQLPSPDTLAAVAQLFQSPHGQELQRVLQNFQQADKTLAATIANNIPNPSQMPVAQLNPYMAHIEKKSSLAEISQEEKIKIFLSLKKVKASTLSFSLQRTALEISLAFSRQE